MKVGVVLLVLGIVGLGSWFTGTIIKRIGYNQEVGGYLERAANANTVELAIAELEKATTGMVARGLCNEALLENTSGWPVTCYTSVLYNTPDEDLGYWRRNINTALLELRELPPDADRLLTSNTLMKLRETLAVASTEKGSMITSPEGASRYPHNTAWAVFGILSFILLLIGAGALWIDDI